MDRNYARRMRPQATVSNHLSGTIICPSVRPFVRCCFAIFVFVLISRVGVQRRDSFISIVWVQSRNAFICPSFCPSVRLYVFLSGCPGPSVRLYVFLSGCPGRFLVIIHAARNCAQSMRMHATGSNTMSSSIICPLAFSRFYLY